MLQQLRDVKQLKGRCGSCEFNELCGGCRCRAYAAFGDVLQEDPACTYQPSGQSLQFDVMVWSAEARARLERIPITFIRNKVRQGVETYAQRKSMRMITPELMSEAVANEGRAQTFGRSSEFLPQTNHEETKR